MTKDIKDYIAYYLGQDWEWKQYSGDFNSGIYSTDVFSSQLLREIGLGNGVAKPILRPLSSMTEEEFRQFKNAADNDAAEMILIPSMNTVGQTRLFKTFEATATLLKMGFDLFGLINAGLAIDKTTQP